MILSQVVHHDIDDASIDISEKFARPNDRNIPEACGRNGSRNSDRLVVTFPDEHVVLKRQRQLVIFPVIGVRQDAGKMAVVPNLLCRLLEAVDRDAQDPYLHLHREGQVGIRSVIAERNMFEADLGSITADRQIDFPSLLSERRLCQED